MVMVWNEKHDVWCWSRCKRYRYLIAYLLSYVDFVLSISVHQICQIIHSPWVSLNTSGLPFFCPSIGHITMWRGRARHIQLLPRARSLLLHPLPLTPYYLYYSYIIIDKKTMAATAPLPPPTIIRPFTWRVGVSFYPDTQVVIVIIIIIVIVIVIVEVYE